MAGLGVDFNVSSALSPLLGANNNVPGPLVGNLPWAGIANPGPDYPQGTNSSVTSAFFPFLKPNPNLWDKLVDYRLIVIDTSNGNKVVGGNQPEEIRINPLGNGTLAFTPMSSAWEFRLPITPQQLSITDAFSINTSATLRGILEEHSGARFKNIAVQGTFGVWPGRPAIVKPPGTPSFLQSVFGGTISSAQNVATQFTSIINNLTTGSNASKPVNLRPDQTGPANETITDTSNPEYGGFGTGYYQQLMLQQFLEQYAEAKRNPDNAGWRLVFDIPRQNQSFVVTPISYTWNENVNRPMEVNYSLQFKAWRRIDLKSPAAIQPLQVTQLTPGTLQRILNTIQAAQNTAAAAVNLIGAVRSDVDNILNIIRQTGLLVKGIAGVALAAADLPAQLVKDTKSTISNFLSTVNPNNLFGPSATDSTTLNVIKNIQQANARNEGLSPAAVASGQLGAQAQVSQTLAQSNTAFNSPLQYPLLFSQVPVNSITLNTQQQTALQNEINNVNSFTVANLKTMRATILTLCTQLANSFGGGDAYYSTLYNQPQPPSGTQPMNLDQYDVLLSFYDLLEAYDILTATNQLDDTHILNGEEFVNALAATSGIPFSIPNSKIQVPVPYGSTMEQIAMRYLGDPQRWVEIAVLNDLQEPYLDYSGFQYPLLSNADGRNIVVGYNTDLYIGQTVYLYANTQTPTARTITSITTLSQTSFLITLDGLANLSGFTLANQAYLQAYLPQTVNAQSVIWIPSDLPATPYDQISIPASVANVDLVGLSKVDLLLTPQGDLAIDNAGDFQLAAGITNLIQSLAIKFGTTQGSYLLEPTFGLGVKAGQMTSNVSAKDIYSQINQMVIADPRFQAISDLQITMNAPQLSINLSVQLAGQSGVFPVGFQIPYSTAS